MGTGAIYVFITEARLVCVSPSVEAPRTATAGQLRYPWVRMLEFQTKQNWLTDEVLRLFYEDPEGLQILNVTLDKANSAAALAPIFSGAAHRFLPLGREQPERPTGHSAARESACHSAAPDPREDTGENAKRVQQFRWSNENSPGAVADFANIRRNESQGSAGSLAGKSTNSSPAGRATRSRRSSP